MPKLTRGDLDAEFSDTSARRDHPGRKGFELLGKRIAGWLYPNGVDKNDKRYRFVARPSSCANSLQLSNHLRTRGSAVRGHYAKRCADRDSGPRVLYLHLMRG